MATGGKRLTGALSRRALLVAASLSPALAASQSKKPSSARAEGPALSTARSIMAGAPLNVFLNRAPAGARLAIARPDDPPHTAIVVVAPRTTTASLPTPGVAGGYELRLTVEMDGAPAILLRQPLETTEPGATLAAPERVGRGQALPVRGIGPNGEQDRVALLPPDAPLDAEGPHFFPAENVEATLEAPEQPGSYELRYVLNAPVSGLRVIARRAVQVE